MSNELGVWVYKYILSIEKKVTTHMFESRHESFT